MRVELGEILESLKAGRITLSRAEKLLSLYSIEKVGRIARVDIDRQKRRGIPEIVFAQGKTALETRRIVEKIMSKADRVVVSRIRSGDCAGMIAFAHNAGWKVSRGQGSTSIMIFRRRAKKTGGIVGILAAGTSDIGVAEEARLVCEAMGCECHTSYDVGVAGIQRVFFSVHKIIEAGADAIVVAAGMEGALATVVTALVDVPVVGVPVSVGYGYGREGVGALAAMLQSCSLGMSVVNIDNGIGAGAAAAAIARQASKRRQYASTK